MQNNTNQAFLNIQKYAIYFIFYLQNLSAYFNNLIFFKRRLSKLVLKELGLQKLVMGLQNAFLVNWINYQPLICGYKLNMHKDTFARRVKYL